MKCKDFQAWLETKGDSSEDLTEDMSAHLASCPECSALYSLDKGLDQKIQSALTPVDVPNRLINQIESALDEAAPAGRISRLKLAGVLLASIVICFFLLQLLVDKPFRYQNLQELSESIITSHMQRNTRMTFKSGTPDAEAMLSRELKFNVIFPDLTDKGYVLLGGRLCVLGKCKIAYLFYEKQNKISSLIILNYDHLDFEMAEGSRFSNSLKGYHTDIWKKNSQVYAMVY